MCAGSGVLNPLAGKDGADSRRWFVVKSLPRRELLAEQHLQRQKFTTFLPLITASANNLRGTGVTRHAAFFPGYLFVRLDLAADRWRSVNGTIGVSNILHVGGRPTPAPVGLVEHLVSRTNELGELGFEDAIDLGRAIRIVGGPFDRLLGTFQGLDGPGRVRVLLELMGRPVTVSLSRASVMTV